MDWAKQFYARQNELIGVYRGDVQNYHQEKVTLIQKAHPTAKTILELGAGGGQMAVATSLTGYHVSAIELVPALAELITQLAEKHQQTITVLNGDFYTVNLDTKFDVITYWDGFGVGSDSDQIQLLKRCADWLKPAGVMLLDVYTPWYWANTHGQEMQFETAHRRYEFDATECRMLDTWWHADTPDEHVTQSLRCYTPADLKLLLQDTGLSFMDVIETGGAVNSDKQYDPHVALHQAMSYTAKLEKSG